MQPRRHRASRLAGNLREARRHTDEFDDGRGDELDWVWVGDQRMFVVGHTCGGAPFGCYEDELEDLP
ncbi:MAG: hypothetical protein ACRDST_07685 [Pseudonocardiaceae bacterium]